VESKVYSKNGKYYIELPHEIVVSISQGKKGVEIKKINGDVFVIVLKNTKPSARQQNGNDKSLRIGLDVLNKLIKIKFSKRTVPNVQKMLNSEEITTLNRLIDEGYVTVYKSKKYPNGVYNIDDSFFKSSEPHKVDKRGATTKTKVPHSRDEPSKEPSKEVRVNNNIYSLLKKQGYLVIDTDKDARYISYIIKKNKEDKLYVGIHGFDNKYYILDKNVLKSIRISILGILSEPMDSATISKKLNENQNLIKGALAILLESGDIIEKRKGRYVSV